jgi:hypothetical protein
MTSKDKIDSLVEDLKTVLVQGSNTFDGDVDGQGLLWVQQDYNKQFVFHRGPDRFFSSETIDLARGKGITVDGVPLVNEKELGTTVTKSNLREIGRLRKLDVDGPFSVNQFLFYDANSDRLGLGTDTPNAALSVFDEGVEIVLGAREYNKGGIGTFNHTPLELVTDNTTRITITAGGDIELGNKNFDQIKVSVLGSLSINSTNVDPRADLDVKGPAKINGILHLRSNEVPSTGNFNQGDIVWNSQPRAGVCVGWVCTKSGAPGVWNAFGEIK